MQHTGLIFITFALVALGIAGCGDESSDAECGIAQDCPEGNICADGACFDCSGGFCACDFAQDCPIGESCVDNRCGAPDAEPDPQPGPDPQPEPEPEPIVCGPLEGDVEAPRPTPDAACPSGFFEEGICQPMPPTPAAAPNLINPDGCPGETTPEGLCLPDVSDEETWACPEGWLRVVDETPEGDFIACSPPELPEDCDAGFMPLVGQAECVRIGVECPGGDELWHPEGDIQTRAEGFDGNVLYVAAGAAPGGNGSRELPFGSASEAMATASDGDIVALGVGEYLDSFGMAAGVALVGACVEGVSIAPVENSEEEAIIDGADGMFVSDLTLTGDRVGFQIDAPIVEARVQSVWVNATMRNAISVVGGRGVEFADLLLTDTRPIPSDQSRGRGMFIGEDSEVTLTRLTLSGNTDRGIIASGEGMTINATDIAIANTQPRQSDQISGDGFVVFSDAETLVTMTRVLAVRNHAFGLSVVGPGIEAELTDIAVIDTQLQVSDQTRGIGLSAHSGASASMARVYLSGNHSTGFLSLGDGTQINATDVFIADTLFSPEQENANVFSGTGIESNNGGTLIAERVVVLRSHDAGISVFGENSEINMSDAFVLDTQTKPVNGGFGRGISANNGRLTLERAVVARNKAQGVLASQNAELELIDVLVDDTGPRESNQSAGRGLMVQEGAVMTVERGIVSSSQGNGAATLGGQLSLTDVIITDTVPSPDGFGTGHGLIVNFAGQAVLERVLVHNNASNGIDVKSGSNLQLTDVTISETQPNGTELDGGQGIVVQNSRIAGLRVTIDRNTDAGLVAFGNARVSMADLVISQTQSRADGRAGFGLVMNRPSDVIIDRAILLGNKTAGILMENSGSQLEASDILILDTQPQESDQRFGYGLYGLANSQATFQRARFSNNHQAAINAFTIELQLTDITITGTKANEGDSTSARGMNIQNGSKITAERAFIGNNQAAGILVGGGGAALTLRDAHISNPEGRGLSIEDGGSATLERVALSSNLEAGVFVSTSAATMTDVLIEGSEPDAQGGSGLVLAGTANVEMTRFQIDQNARAGIEFDANSTLDARTGELSGNGAGISDASGASGVVLSCVEIKDNGCDADDCELDDEPSLTTLGPLGL